MFRFAGYRSPTVFKSIQEKDIDKVELFIRTKLIKIANTSDYNPIDLFGPIFANDPTSFEFLDGEKKLLKDIRVHVQQILDVGGENKNIDYFRPQQNDENVKLRAEKECDHSTAVKTNAQIMECPTNFFLNRLVSTANQNATRQKNGYRYDVDIRRIASYLRMITGRLGYESIQKNLESALPSLPSTNRYIQKSPCCVTEGILRSHELLLYLNERNAPLIVTISEDATRIVGRPQYDSKTNQIVGFVLPVNEKNGMPVPFEYNARNATEMISYFLNDTAIASNINVIMAQPIGPDYIAPFCLLLFGTDSKYTCLDVQKRWTFIISELKKLNIWVLAVASDSEPRYNSAQRALSKLGYNSDVFRDIGPTDWFKCGKFNKNELTIFVQDTVHIGTKMRNLILKTIMKNHKLKFGKYYIQSDHLKQLIDKFSKDKHCLTPNVINPIDKQNFQSAQRICEQRVIDLLINNIPESQATAKYLKLMQNMIESYLNVNLSPLERVYKLWYTVFLMRIWRVFVISKKGLKLKDNFVSCYLYYCIELNAHSMVHSLIGLKDQPQLFQPHLYDSQPCESTFRQVRSLSSVFSTVTNCTTKEMTERIKKIQLQNDIIAASCPNYVFPRLTRTYNKHGICYRSILPTIKEIYDEIQKTKKHALQDAVYFGLITKNTAKKFDLSCKVKPYNQIVQISRNQSQTQGIYKAKSNHKSAILKLRSITLKNFAENFDSEKVPENSPYVEVYNNGKKRIIVKKTSFCWLLRKDSQRLSSDRLERVKEYPNGKKLKISKPKMFASLNKFKKSRKK